MRPFSDPVVYTDEDFARLLADDPYSLVARVARGISRIASDPAGARRDLDVALEQVPHHAQAHYGVALLCRRSDPDQALHHLDQALATDPNLTDAVQLRALVRARKGDPAALDDVERLLRSPTPYRLYNAACAVAVYSERARQSRLASHALELLARAVDAGFPRSEAAGDPDLKSLHAYAKFSEIIAETHKPHQ